MTQNIDDEITEREPALTLDDALEAARNGERPRATAVVGPVIGSQRLVQADIPTPTAVRVVSRCSCGCLSADWHVGSEGHESLPLAQGEWDRIGSDYHEQLADAMKASRSHKWLEWGPNLWRAIPEFSNYEMNGYTREVRRREYSRTLKSGVVRHYAAKAVQARRSSVTLSRDGVAVTRGIEKLWRATFPEYVIDPNSWQGHALRRDNIPAELGRVVQSHR